MADLPPPPATVADRLQQDVSLPAIPSGVLIIQAPPCGTPEAAAAQACTAWKIGPARTGWPEPYQLITITHDGTVRNGGSFLDPAVCEEAKTFALTGLTKTQRDEDLARKQREQDAWRAAHPPRKPSPREQRQLAALGKQTGIPIQTDDGSYALLDADGLLLVYPRPDAWVVSNIYPWSIEKAECVKG